MGQICWKFPYQNCVSHIENSSFVYNLDCVYNPETSQVIKKLVLILIVYNIQQRIYDDIGKETIADILNGYNGTIFAYGPTGTGKTHTMFGEIESKENKGLIPRVAHEIFSMINNTEGEVDFIVKCSMLEIYKENLNDLLAFEKTDLKVKESVSKGVFVHNLTDIVYILY